MIFNLIIAYNEFKKLNIRFGSQYLISLPICIFFLYLEGGVDLQKILIGILILFSLNIFSRDFNNSSILKSIFSLGIIYTIMSFVNINLSVFFFLIIFLFRYTPDIKKTIITLALSILVTLQLLILITYLITGDFFYHKPEFMSGNISPASNFTENEFIWVILIVIAFLIVFFYNKKSELKFSSQNKMLNIFMIFWLIITVLFRYFNLYSGEGKWSMSLIPTAYFIGIWIKRAKEDYQRDILVFSLIFVAITSKIYFS
jgi:magnesium-transporting ATPase (P-type)